MPENTVCPDCQSENVVVDHEVGEVVIYRCQDCGREFQSGIPQPEE